MSLKHFEIYVDQTRKRLCMNHAAGRSGREQAGMPVLDSPTGTELQQPQLWQPVTQVSSEKWFCSSSTKQVSPCSVNPSDSP